MFTGQKDTRQEGIHHMHTPMCTHARAHARTHAHTHRAAFPVCQGRYGVSALFQNIKILMRLFHIFLQNL